jgi:hypothetical protein
MPFPDVRNTSRSFALLVPLCLIVVIGGCSHRRSAMRPVFVEPAPAVIAPSVDCPNGDCGTSGATIGDPLPSNTPIDSGVAPSSTIDEPMLEPSTVNPTSGSEPVLNAPRSTRRLDRRPATSKRATFRSRVTSFVNDPNDLFTPPKADRTWRYIVLHHSAHATGGYAQLDRDHRQELGTKGCGYHFVIGNGTESPDGQIEVAERWSDQKGGAHCRDAKLPDVNDYGIGICLIGDLDQSEPTPKQIQAAQALVAYLQDRYAISPEHIGTHSALAQNPTACPGKHFPTQAILGARDLALR